MSQKNTLTLGGAGAGGVTALQLANDLATLTMGAIAAIDGVPGFDASVPLDMIDAGTRTCTVLWGIAITIAAASIGRFIARFIEPPSASV